MALKPLDKNWGNDNKKISYVCECARACGMHYPLYQIKNKRQIKNITYVCDSG